MVGRRRRAVDGPIESLLLVLTGRSSGLPASRGDGLAELRGRMAQT
jgi:hypothetical protein